MPSENLQKIVVLCVIVLAVAGVIGLGLFGASDKDLAVEDATTGTGASESVNVDAKLEAEALEEDDETFEETGWRNYKFEDIRTGETFRISDLSDKPVLLESFAVWCPVCTKQQAQIKILHGDPGFGESFYSVALNVDEGEDKDLVLNHIDRNGFDWRYAISPAEITKELIDEFGNSIVSVPGAPVILVCPNGEAELLDRGVKKSGELKEEILKGCGV